MRFTPCSSPLSGQNTTLGLWIPHCSGWPRKHRRLRKANPLRTWCQPNTMTSEMSSPRKPLTSSHHRRHGTMPLISHLRLNSLTPGCSPCPLQNRRSLTTVRAHLRLRTCYALVLMELRCIFGMGTQGDKSLLDAYAELRRKLSSHSAQVRLYIMGG